LFVVVTATGPVLVPVALLVDAVRRIGRRGPWMTIRMVAFLWVYLSAQVGGLVWMFASWLASGFGIRRKRLERATYHVQRLWAGYLFSAVRTIFGLRLDVTGDEAISPGPAVFMSRHASLIDTLLPSVLITSGHGIRLRYVLKKELLIDPALDVAGNRVPNYFVDRAAQDIAGELRGIASLADGLGADEGVFIYPEGTRFRAERQERAIDRLVDSPQLHTLAKALRHVHPPRPGGSLALLDARVAVVFCAHAGLDGFASVADVWNGSLVGKTVTVKFWRVPASEIPRDRDERAAWLFGQWQRVDAEVGTMLAGSANG
jgi:1-acyl-sn-glycerol-3-phosphate acyltransferase